MLFVVFSACANSQSQDILYETAKNVGINSKTKASSVSESKLVVVVNASNPITQLSKKEVIDIYMGRFKTFPNNMQVSPIDFPEASEQKQLFYQLLVNKSERKIKAYWSRLLFSGRATPPIQASSKSQVISKLINDPNGLAYIQERDVTAEMKIVYRL